MRDSRYWMGQTDWFLDDSGSVEATGADDGHPIPEAERQRRMGSCPEWNGVAYHLYLHNSLPRMRIVGQRNLAQSTTPTIFVHGSAVQGQGASVAFPTVGTAQVAALVTLDKPTNVPWKFTCSAIPASWTASGLINDPTQNVSTPKRGRMTSGANVGGKFWPIEDMGTKQVMLDEPTTATTYTSPFTTPSSTFSPANGDQFVVEDLRTISQLMVDITSQIPIVFDSMAVTSIIDANRAFLVFDGCHVTVQSRNQSRGMLERCVFNGCRILGNTSIDSNMTSARVFELTNGHVDGSIGWRAGAAGIISRLMIHGTSSQMTLWCFEGTAVSGAGANNTRGWLIDSIGIVNVPNVIPMLLAKGCRLDNPSIIWGSGNSFSPLALLGNSMLGVPQQGAGVPGIPLPTSWFYIDLTANGGNWIVCSTAVGGGDARAKLNAFDPVTREYSLDKRLLSPALLNTHVSNGGFGGEFNDPETGCRMVQLNQG